jgi:phosphomannomutase/phosphoglucomutase
MINTTSLVNPSIFRAYDIRGIVGETLTDEVAYLIGKAVGTRALELNEQSIALGRDGRLSGVHLQLALSKGIMSTGCHVVDLGVIPTPLLYYATHHLASRSGIVLTGSHNPPQYNGLKIMLAGKTLAEAEIQDLYLRIIGNVFVTGLGSQTEVDVITQYTQEVLKSVTLKKPLKIVVDCGNGVAGCVAPALFRAMGCEVHELFCEVDGTFPNHHPDPGQVENLQDLILAVKNTQADIGLAFDGDGDRLGVVTSTGEIIWPDRLLMLFAKCILQKAPGATIIYDVKCTNNLEAVITQFGGVPLMWKTGHSLIKSKLAESDAILAGEMSGHIFIKDDWYGFDDAIYAGARLLHMLSESSQTSDALFEQFPKSINTPELKIYVDEEIKFNLMDRLIANANFADASNINTLDGIRVNFESGWGLVRPSNTTPCLVLRFEAQTLETLVNIQTQFRTFLLTTEPTLDLPF